MTLDVQGINTKLGSLYSGRMKYYSFLPIKTENKNQDNLQKQKKKELGRDLAMCHFRWLEQFDSKGHREGGNGMCPEAGLRELTY